MMDQPRERESAPGFGTREWNIIIRDKQKEEHHTVRCNFRLPYLGCCERSTTEDVLQNFGVQARHRVEVDVGQEHVAGARVGNRNVAQ